MLLDCLTVFCARLWHFQKLPVLCHAKGALVTQLFFDNDIFYRFRERVMDIGITVPICAGIIPIISVDQISKIRSEGA